MSFITEHKQKFNPAIYMGIKTFATKAFSWVREGFASWDSMYRFLRSVKENDDLDFY